MKDILASLLPVPRSARTGRGISAWQDLAVRKQMVPDLGQEAYRLDIGDGGILVEAASERGFFLAQQTLRQLRMLSPASCPDLRIEDEPALDVRGYMLDISRCKVPTMEQLFHMVDLLAFFKYNQLQLYMEHTFAYSRHPEVWKDASPLTAGELRELKTYCADRFIELVPNQNAFGHMERWLKHDRYRELAESPEGFHHPVSGWRPEGSVLYPDDKAVRFIEGLLDELLPCFDSEWVHLGCDEPWELGQGRSFERVQQVGRHKVFRDYVTRLHGLVHKRGRRMLFWSDELREDPKRVEDFPSDIIPVVWGYEGNHPFHEECAVYDSLDRAFLIAPGDSSWNSFTGRLDNACRNIRRAADAALQDGALGMLLTSWGDNGHQQVWPAQLPGMLVFAAAAWNPGQMERMDLARSLDCFVFQDTGTGMGEFWDTLARIDSHIPVRINQQNSSFPYDALFQPPQRVHHAFRGESRDCLFSAFDRLELCEKLLARANPACVDAQWLIEESRLAHTMTHAGLKRAEAILKGRPELMDGIDCDAIMLHYRNTWLHRNREGGLGESAAHLRHCPGGSRELRTD